LTSSKKVPAILLVGGLGTRLRSVVSDRPKPMADIQGKPFLEYLVKRLIDQGFDEIIMCVSYMKENIINYFTTHYDKYVRFAVEDEPLGTAGALRNAERMFSSANKILVLNGDTIVDMDYRDLVSFHDKNQADVTLTLTKGDSAKYGRVKMRDIRIVDFAEKSGEPTGLISAGVYVIETSALKEIPEKRIFSLEKEFLPSILNTKRVFGYVIEQSFVDMGEPATYEYLKKNSELLEGST